MNRILFEPDEIVDGVATVGGVRAEHILGVLHGEVGQPLKTGVIGGLVGTSELAAVSASASQLICLVSEDLGYECTCSYCAGVCFTYGDDFLDLIWRYTCSYCSTVNQ